MEIEGNPEVNSLAERTEALKNFEEAIRNIFTKGKELGYWGPDNIFNIHITSPDFAEEWIYISQNLKPDTLQEYSFGVLWEYEVSMSQPDRPELDQKGSEISYLFTYEDGDILKVVVNEEDHLSIPPKRPETISDFVDDIKRRQQEQKEFQENITLGIQMGTNGRPIEIDEINWLTAGLSKAEIIPYKDAQD